MTDLGAADLESHYGKSSQNAALKAAIDLLPKVATASAEHIAPYTKERMHEELHIFLPLVYGQNAWPVGGIKTPSTAFARS